MELALPIIVLALAVTVIFALAGRARRGVPIDAGPPTEPEHVETWTWPPRSWKSPGRQP